MNYHLTGAINAVIFLLTLWGLWLQLGLVWGRKRRAVPAPSPSERPTAVLSLNQFVSSFLAFFSFFLYGACLPQFNHYLVWPRLVAAVLTLVVLYEMMVDRRDALCTGAFVSCLAALLVMPLLLWMNPQLAATLRVFSQGLVVVATVFIAQGYSHQVMLIRRTGQTGAVSLRFHQFFLLKDLSTIAFALAMKLAAGWPLFVMSSVSALTKLATMWHFRWVRLSPAARKRREGAAKEDVGPSPVSYAEG